MFCLTCCIFLNYTFVLCVIVGLNLEHIGILPFFCHKGFMCSVFYHVPVFKHGYIVAELGRT